MSMGQAAQYMAKIEDQEGWESNLTGCDKRSHQNHSCKGSNVTNKTMEELKGHINKIKGHMFDCTNTSYAENDDHSLEKCWNYIATKLTREGSKVHYTIEKEQHLPFMGLTGSKQELEEWRVFSQGAQICY